MTERRSSRAAAKVPVKYTSDSDNSELDEKKSAISNKKTVNSTLKKGTKRSQFPDGVIEKISKRRKKSPQSLAAEYNRSCEYLEEGASKQETKQQWESWLSDNDAFGNLLDAEPERDEAVTQTDAHEQYDLKASELVALKHFKKPNQYGRKTKLFLAADVKKVAFRKYGLLAGFTEDSDILEKGEELWKGWKEKHDAKASERSTKEAAARATRNKSKTSKQRWAAYVEEHSVGDDRLSEEPEDSINQTDSKTQFLLLPGDLVCLPHFPKPISLYKNTAKLFHRENVRDLAYRKAATLEGLDEANDSEGFLTEGKRLLGPAIVAAANSKAPEKA